MEENVISKAIVETYMKEFVSNLDVDVAVVGAGPSGLVCAYYLALKGLKVTVYERALRIGGGMPAGGMMFNNIVVEEEARSIMEEFDIRLKKYDAGLYTADALETISGLAYKTIKAGVKIYNLIGVEDVIIRDRKITGVVLNWSAVDVAHLHVDPLGVQAKSVVDATGHDSEVCKIVEKKVGGLSVKGERSMWAEVGERALIENTKEVYPNLFVCGMAANNIYGSPRMGPVFGGMLLSGKKAASLIDEKLNL
jgi:sulfide-dependent adenosine diphosphate thiazole synthase